MLHNARNHGMVGLALATVAVVMGCGKGPPQLPSPEAPTVAVVNPSMRPYSPYKDFTGRLATKDPVKVVPRVSGIILRRLFTDGQVVTGPITVLGLEIRPGQRLFEIDPVQYDADVKKADADQKKSAADIKNWTAQIELAEAELKRVTDQLNRGVGIPADKDKAVASRDVAKAQKEAAIASKAAADATLLKAQENLSYCTVTAPTTGRVRQALVAEGALVDAYKTELVEIDPIDPMYVIFDVDELTSLWYRDQIARGTIDDPHNPVSPLRCWITLKDGRTVPPFDQPGIPLDYFDPEIDRGTGTRTIRATFPNPEVDIRGPDGKTGRFRRLSSGDSVRVRVDAGKPVEVLAVPETAVFAQQRKRYVYIVDAESKAQLREVEVGASFEGFIEVNRRTSDAMDATGLKETDRVIVDNLLRVRPGIAVTIKH